MYVNPDIKKTKRIFPQQNRYGFKRYDMNENPEGLPAEFVEAVRKEITPEFLAVYPEPDRFVKKYADYLGEGYAPENIMVTNGSDMAIRYLLETFGEPGKDVVTVTPSFEMYRVNCSILGLKHVPVPYEDDLTIRADKIIEAITNDTRVVVLLNPNNPIGDAFSEEEAEAVIRKAQEANALVIIDEAYHYFYPETFVSYALRYENVVVMRTFSKLFSLAACRLGVMIASPQIIQYAKNGKLTFDVNSIALLFGERILDRPDIIEKLIWDEKDGKEYLCGCLQESGYSYRSCLGNFILIETRKEAKHVAETLEKEHNVLVHAYGNDLLKKYIRVSVGSPKAMKLFWEAFQKADYR